jgi:ABC-2 type transport system permease protein
MIRGAIAIFKRDFKKFLSNPFVLIMTLFMPIMYLVIFGNAMGGTITGIPVGVVQEQPYLNETPLYLQTVDALAHVSRDDRVRVFVVTSFSSEAAGKAALEQGRIVALAVFPSAVSNDHRVRLSLDSSDYMVPSLVESTLATLLVRTGGSPGMQVTKIYGEIDYIQFFGVGVIVMGIFMSTMMGGGLALIRDREMGIVEGYLVTPVRRSSIILGIIGSGTVKALLAGVIIFVVDLLITGIVIRDPLQFALVFVVLVIISVGITSLVVALSSRYSNQQTYASSIAFLNLILFMTSGAFYPILGVPDWLRWITAVNPEYYAVHALRSLVLRGQGLEQISIDLLAIGLFSGAAILLGISSFRRTLE